MQETGATEVEELWRAASIVVCVTVGYLEVRAAIVRRLDRRTAERAARLLDARWKAVETIDVDARLIGLAARVVDVHRLRMFDALHLAAALEFGEPDLVFASWDEELRRAAELEGFAAAP